jgi:hypothetical protein
MMSLPDRTEKVLTASSKVALVPYDWSADGRSILVPCKDGNPKRSAACLVDAFGFPAGAAVPRVLFSSDTVHVEPQAFSPDERWIGINVSDAPTRPGVTALYAVRNDGSHWTPLTDNGSRHGKLRWSSDGQSIYYLSNEGGVVNVWGRRFDPKAGKPLGHKFQVTTFKSARRMVSPDMATVEIGILAGRLAVPIAESSSRLWTLQVTKD